ncbi:gastrula zinc finger protein XlCGF53.1-like [Rana temporaria]|uniref:gastrula zinc finger protein XlCGF53.1-like n=1 Tax=Rana temporaria TaxID=8407 RepID=UPI001AAC99CD|nr:gastrula zinc finger protein XlCGF53.1-like [Rana temporaria]
MDHMMSSMRLEEYPSHMTETILNLALEIIYLLTGENFPPVKSGDHLTITVPSSHLLKPKKNNEKKIVEVTNKIIVLLTGEVSGVGNSGTLSSKRQGMCLDGDCIIVCVRFL